MKQQELLSDSQFSDLEIPLAIRRTEQRDLDHHMHTFVELVMVVAGSGTHVFNTEHYPITVGDVFVVPPYTPHGYADTEGLVIYNILFKEKMLARYHDELTLIPGFHGLIYLEPYYRTVRGFSGRLTLSPEQIVRATSLVTRLKDEWDHAYEGRSIMVENLFIELLLFYCRQFSEDTGPMTRVMPVARTIGYLNQHYEESLCLDDLVQVARVSKRSLIRHFKNTTGTSPIRYLQKIRIAKASDMLKTKDRAITQVAMDAGFNDAAYFSLVFKRHTGMTPSEYQQRA